MSSSPINHNSLSQNNAIERLKKLEGLIQKESLELPLDYSTASVSINHEVVEILLNALGKNQQQIPNSNDYQNVISYLSINHKYYKDNVLPSISWLFWNAMNNGGKDNELINLYFKVFSQFSTALSEHIDEEETYFNLMKVNRVNTQLVIKHFTQQHDNETEALDNLIEMLGQLRDIKTFQPINILYTRLQNLSADLKIHNFVEEKILLPALIKLQS